MTPVGVIEVIKTRSFGRTNLALYDVCGEVQEKYVTTRLITSVSGAVRSLEEGEQNTLVRGDTLKVLPKIPSDSIDLIVSSPPYCIGKEYESTRSSESFVETHAAVIPELVRILKPGGSLCWQVGYHVRNGVVLPLDFLVYAEVLKHIEMKLRNRIVWTFKHGLHAKRRFSGRHETLLWFSKGDVAAFDLDAIRVPQRYPGKLHYKGPNKGSLSGNPLGKNPGDVWDVPNVKGMHVEKTAHPCQFPVSIPQTFIRALCPKEGVVMDPFMGVGSTGVAAGLESRRFIGIELDSDYAKIAAKRVRDARSGRAVVRPLNQPVQDPDPTQKVAQRPAHFRG
jgi:adenine-specific DNA-methyltransferase